MNSFKVRKKPLKTSPRRFKRYCNWCNGTGLSSFFRDKAGRVTYCLYCLKGRDRLLAQNYRLKGVSRLQECYKNVTGQTKAARVY